MLKLALVAAAFTPAVVSAQVIEVTTDRSVVDLSVPGGNEVEVSITIDHQAYFPDFYGWSYVEGYVVGNGGQLQIPVEHDDDVNTGDWSGRRPTSIPEQGSSNNGGFRYDHPPYREAPGDDGWDPDISYYGTIVDWDSVLGNHGQNYQNPEILGVSIGMMQRPTALGGFNQDQSERIEIFRTTMVFDTPGVHDISFIPLDIGYWSRPDLSYTVLGAQRHFGVDFVQVATVEARIPAPATLLALAAFPMVRRRREAGTITRGAET